MFGPILQGAVVKMRPVEPAEAAAIRAWFADASITRLMARVFPPSEESEKEWLERMGRSETDIVWGLEHEGRLVGLSAVHHIDWMNQRGTTGSVLGDRSVWGRGIGRESMQLRTRFCFTQTTLRKLDSGYFEGNIASARAQAAAGYREIGRRRQHFFRGGRWLDQVMTEVLRDDWLVANRD